jgi:hypothetical protein
MSFHHQDAKDTDDSSKRGYWAQRSFDILGGRNPLQEREAAASFEKAPTPPEPEENVLDEATPTENDDVLDDARRWLCSKAYYRKASACFRRAVRFHNEGNSRKALAEPQLVRCQHLLEASLWEVPENTSSHFLLVAVLLQLGDFEAAKREAIILLHRVSAAARWPDMKDPVLHQAIAQASWRMQSDGDAMNRLLEATNEFPEHPQLCMNLSEMVLAAKCHTSAKDMAQLALLRNDSEWCACKLSDSEKERATCCLSLSLKELNSSLEEAISQTPELKIERPSKYVFEKQCSEMMRRLGKRSVSVKATELRNDLDGQRAEIKRRVEKTAAAATFGDGFGAGGELSALKTAASLGRATKDKPQDSEPNGDSRFADKEVARSRLRQDEPKNMLQSAVSQAASDLAFMRSKWSSDNGDRAFQKGQNRAKPAEKGEQSFGPKDDIASNVSAVMGDTDDRASKAVMGDTDLMAGLLPAVRPKQEPLRAPQMDSAKNSSFGFWCCITECKQQLRRL